MAIILTVPGLMLAYAFHSWTWLFVTPIAEVILLCLIAGALGCLPRRNVTPEDLADQLEKHLVGNEGFYDWDELTSVAPAGERLNRLIWRLSEYDRLETAEKREKFREIIEALRRGEIPD